MNYEQKLHKVMQDIENLLLSKHNDYGSSNLLKHGLFGIVVRLSDKQARLDNLVGGGKTAKVSESVGDTLMDMAGYAIQALVLFFDSESN